MTKVKSYSVAGEAGKVSVGDLIEEIDSSPTFDRPPEDVAQFVKRCARRPIAIAVVKAEWRAGKVRNVTRTSYGIGGSRGIATSYSCDPLGFRL